MRKLVMKNDFLSEVADALIQGKSVKVRIDGQSMCPFIIGGRDVVEIVPLKANEKILPWHCFFYQWEGLYMVHRCVGYKEDCFLMLGDGNLTRIEMVKRNMILGVLRNIYYPDGSRQDCLDKTWLMYGILWYRFRAFRRFFLLIVRLYMKFQPK